MKTGSSLGPARDFQLISRSATGRGISPRSPLQVAAFALRESARIPTSTSRAGAPPPERLIKVLAGDEAGEARWHASDLEGVTMSRSSLMTALALLLSTTAVSAAKTPAKVVVHEGDSLQAAIDAASPGATIVVEPGIYHGDDA